MNGNFPVMPFGKFNGKPLAEIDTHYLTWLLHEGPRLRRRLRQEITDELRSRGVAVDPEPARPRPLDAAALTALVDRWHAHLTARHHPNGTGGSVEAMHVVDHSRALLLKMLRDAGGI